MPSLEEPVSQLSHSPDSKHEPLQSTPLLKSCKLTHEKNSTCAHPGVLLQDDVIASLSSRDDFSPPDVQLSHIRLCDDFQREGVISARENHAVTRNGKEQSSKAELTLDRVEDAVAGLQCKLFFKVSNKGVGMKSTGFMVEVRYQDDVYDLVLAQKCPYTRGSEGFTLTFRPLRVGTVLISLSTFRQDVENVTFHVDMLVQEPLLHFNDGSDWPVAVTSCKYGHIWVAYSHHVTKFSAEGKKLERFCSLEDGYINDLAVCDDVTKVAASLCGWEYIEDQEVRMQGVRLYDANGHLLHHISREELAFEAPVLHIDFCSESHLVIADRDVIYTYNVIDKVVERRMTVEELGCVSRIRAHGGRYYTVDGASSTVSVYSDIGVLEDRINVRDSENNPFRGLSGIAIGQDGHVIVCDSVTSKILAYKEGVLCSSIERSWSDLKWPLSLTTHHIHERHLVVADHGNSRVCVYKY